MSHAAIRQPVLSSSKQPKYALPAWVSCLSVALFFMFEFMQLNVFNALGPALLSYFNVSAAKLGNLSAFYVYAVVICLFPMGILLDRYSTRLIVSSCMFVCVVCVFLFSMATALWQAELCRFLTGVAGSACVLSCVRLTSRWFPANRMAFVLGLIATIVMLGGFLAQTVMTDLADQLGWRGALLCDAAFGLVLWFGVMFGIRDFPPNFVAPQAKDTKFSLATCWRVVSRNPQNWLAGVYGSLMNLPIFLLGAMWGSLYLVQVRGLERGTSALIVGALFIGNLVGSPLMGRLSDYMHKRRLCMLISSASSIIIVSLIIVVAHLSVFVLTILFFCLGLITSAQVLVYPIVAESNPPQFIASAESVSCILIMLGGFMQPIFGWLMGLNWHHVYKNGVPFYSAADFNAALWLLPAAFLISFFCALFLRDKCAENSSLNFNNTINEESQWQSLQQT